MSLLDADFGPGPRNVGHLDNPGLSAGKTTMPLGLKVLERPSVRGALDQVDYRYSVPLVAVRAVPPIRVQSINPRACSTNRVGMGM